MYRNLIKNQTNFKAGYSPRSSLRLLMTEQKELLNKVTLGLDRYILNSLKGYFREEGLTEIQFIEALLKGIQGFDSEMPQRQLRLVNAIHTMYEDITMGSEEKITWEIFSNYLINNVRHVKNKQEIPYTFSKSNVNSHVKLNSSISKSIYIQHLKVILMCEQNSSKVQVFDPIKGVLLPQSLINQPKKMTVETSVVKKDKGKTVLTNKQLVITTQVITMDLFYIDDPKFNVFLCSTSDGNIKGWTLTSSGFEPALQPQSQNLVIQHNFKSPIYSMAWDNVNQMLYCGSQKGTIYVWPFKTDTQHPLEGGHDSMVTCMRYLSKLQILASADMDGRFILWDIVTDNKKSFKTHNRGILSMVLSEDLLIFTAGFDHQICVWNPYISGLAHKINIHNSTILSMTLNSNYLFSLDAENQIKITSLKTFQPVFVISPNADKQKCKDNFSCISFVTTPARLVTFGNKIQIYDYDQDKNADLSDNIPLFYTFYFPKTFKLYACTTQRIKIWNVLTGQLQQTFSGISNYQISCIKFQPETHSILIGDTSGYVYMLNMKSCSKIKELPRQPAAVDHIVFIPAIKQNNLLAIVSGYSIINIYKIIPEGYQLTKTFTMNKNTQITALAYNESIRQLIIGNNFGSIELYDVENGKMMIGTNSLDMYSNVVLIQVLQLQGLTLIMEVSYMGTISLLLKLPEKMQRIKIDRIFDVQNKNQYLRINTACWNQESIVLLGDQKGFIVACNMKPILDQIKISPNIYKLKKVCQILWKVKGHPESIMHMRSIQGQDLLLTSAYDKKIKIWNQKNGQFIDHFRQQPFHNQTAVPVFYWRIDQNGTYDIRNSNITEVAILKEQAIQPTEEDIVFNPSWLSDEIITFDSNSISNKFWKVKINFKQKVEEKIKKCQELIRLLLLKKKSTKFQLLLKNQSVSNSQHLLSVQATSRLTLEKHKRFASNISEQLTPHRPRIQHQLPQIERPHKLDLISRAQVSAQRKFRQDIAMIDSELKHQVSKNKVNGKTHHSLNKRKSTILSSYQSKQFFSKQYKINQKKGLINLSGEEIGALDRLSQALKNLNGFQKMRKVEISSKTIRLKKK